MSLPNPIIQTSSFLFFFFHFFSLIMFYVLQWIVTLQYSLLSKTWIWLCCYFIKLVYVLVSLFNFLEFTDWIHESNARDPMLIDCIRTHGLKTNWYFSNPKIMDWTTYWALISQSDSWTPLTLSLINGEHVIE